MTQPDASTLARRLAALGQPPPATLTSTRLALHWAAQPVAAFGVTMVPARDDFSHTSLRWSEPAQAMLSQPQPDTGLQAGLHLADFATTLYREGKELERLALAGQTLDQAHEWLAQALGRAGQPQPEGMTRPDHLGDMPAHPAAQGEPFAEPDPAARAELSRWFSAADALLQAVVTEIPAMGPVRCWPHHFDTASLHVLEGEGESMKSIGVGISPGDGGYDEPYLYVTPWPYPQGDLPALPWGRWHTEGWTGAVLRGTELCEALGPERSGRVMEMIRVAHQEGTALLGTRGNDR